MTRALVLAAAAAAVAATPRVGVCWTRNNLPADPAAAALALARVVASARSLRRSEANVLGTCLYTDRKDVARRALATSNATGLIDVIVESPRPEETAAVHERHQHLFASRLGRLRAWVETPFELTLHVDDDTLFCGGAAGVAADLIALNTWDVDIRLTNYFEDRGLGADPATGTAATRDAIAACLRHRCGDACGATGVACLTCQTPCFDDQGAGPCPAVTAAPLERFHAQGGAVFRRRTPEAAEFFRDWARAYLAMWTRRRLRHRPPNATSGPFGDQGPLDALLAERCSYGSSDAWRLGRLPPNWNLRPTSHAAPIWGPVRVVHDKDLNTRCPEGQHDGWRLVRSVGEASTLRKVEKGSLLPDQLKVLNGSLHDSVPLLLYGPLDVVVRPLDAAVERVAVDAFARSDAPADAKSLALVRLQTNAEKTSWKAVAGRRLAPAPLRLGALITIAVLSVLLASVALTLLFFRLFAPEALRRFWRRVRGKPDPPAAGGRRRSSWAETLMGVDVEGRPLLSKDAEILMGD